MLLGGRRFRGSGAVFFPAADFHIVRAFPGWVGAGRGDFLQRRLVAVDVRVVSAGIERIHVDHPAVVVTSDVVVDRGVEARAVRRLRWCRRRFRFRTSVGAGPRDLGWFRVGMVVGCGGRIVGRAMLAGCTGRVVCGTRAVRVFGTTTGRIGRHG